MIEKDVERQIAFLHAAYGLVFGIIFGLYYKSVALPFLSVLIWGLAISYPVMIITKRMFKLSTADFSLKTWIIKGFLYFLSVWMVAWVFVYNLV